MAEQTVFGVTLIHKLLIIRMALLFLINQLKKEYP